MDEPPARSAHVPAPAVRLDAPGGLRGQTPIGDPDDDDWEDDDLDDEDDEDEDEDEDEEPMQLARGNSRAISAYERPAARCAKVA